jgi:hypothetical protein
MRAGSTKPSTGIVFIVVASMSSTLDINVHSTRPDVDALGQLNWMLLRGSGSGREYAAGNNRDSQDDPVHDQSLPDRNRLTGLSAL